MRPIANLKTDRGSALVEALPAILVIVVFVGVLLMAAYLIFARAWMQYQAEQSLYCMAESRTEWTCRRELENRLKRALPWGSSRVVQLQTARVRRNEIWKVEVRWKFGGFELSVRKHLDSKSLVHSKALRW